MLRDTVLYDSFEIVVLRFIRGEELSSARQVKEMNDDGCHAQQE